MRKRTQLLIWLTATFLLLGTALSFAAVGSQHSNGHANAHSTVSQQTHSPEPDATETETPEPDQSGTPGAHPVNHGFYVSQAAHCQNVDDPTTTPSPDFTAPTDCTGKAHGQYVSSVAKSDLGKSNHGNGHGHQ
jgi:hypothetical protein